MLNSCVPAWMRYQACHLMELILQASICGYCLKILHVSIDILVDHTIPGNCGLMSVEHKHSRLF